MIHMLFAEIKYQHGQRNNFPSFLEQAFAHYKYSLTRFHELLQSRTLADVQGMLLIAFKLRNFPKPKAAMLCTQLVIGVAVEANLHRSAEELPPEVQKILTPHDKELRKRVFWTSYALAVGLSGKLGLPLPVRIEDIDIEIPDPVDDSLPNEHLPEERKCSFHVGIAAMKMLAIQGQLYSNILGIRRSTRNYANEVVRLESELQKWKASLPPELTDASRASSEWKVYALYVQFWELEFRFLLRHPVIHSATNPEMYDSNAKTSLEVSAELLGVVKQIHELKCLDIPWINVTVFLASIFTTLFIEDRRQDEITQDELSKLEADMNLWLSIFRDIGQILGMH
jgi:Fungal specific transcription factor domain